MAEEKDSRVKSADMKKPAASPTDPFKPSGRASENRTIGEDEVEEEFLNGRGRDAAEAPAELSTAAPITPKSQLLKQLSTLETKYDFQFEDKERTLNYYLTTVFPSRLFSGKTTAHFLASLKDAAQVSPQAAQRLFLTLPEMYHLQLSRRQIDRWLNPGLDELDAYLRIPDEERSAEKLQSLLGYFDGKEEETQQKIEALYCRSLSTKRTAFGATITALTLFSLGLSLGFVYQPYRVSSAAQAVAAQTEKLSQDLSAAKAEAVALKKEFSSLEDTVAQAREKLIGLEAGSRYFQLKAAFADQELNQVREIVDNYLLSLEGQVIILKGSRGALFDAMCNGYQNDPDYQTLRERFAANLSFITLGTGICSPGRYTCFGTKTK